MTEKDAENDCASGREEATADVGTSAEATGSGAEGDKPKTTWSPLGTARHLASAIVARSERFIEPLGRLRLQLKPRETSDLLTLKVDEGAPKAYSWAERIVQSATGLASRILRKLDKDADAQYEWPGLAYSRPPDQSRLGLMTYLRHRLAGYGRGLTSLPGDEADEVGSTAGTDEGPSEAAGWSDAVMQAPRSTIGERRYPPATELQREVHEASAGMPPVVERTDSPTVEAPVSLTKEPAYVPSMGVVAKETTGPYPSTGQPIETESAPSANPEGHATQGAGPKPKESTQPGRACHTDPVVAAQISEPARESPDSSLRHVYRQPAAVEPASSVEGGASQAGLPRHLERLPQLPTAESRIEELPPQSAASFLKARPTPWQKDIAAETDRTGIGFDARTYGDEKTLAAMNITSLRGHSETVLRLSDDILHRYGPGQKGRKSSGVGGSFIDAFASQPDEEAAASMIGLPENEPEFEPGLRQGVVWDDQPHHGPAGHIVQRLFRESTPQEEYDSGYMGAVSRRAELRHAVLAASPSREAPSSLTVAQAAVDRPIASGAAISDPTGAVEEDTQDGQSTLDMDALARQVYRIILSRLALEKERHAFSV